MCGLVTWSQTIIADIDKTCIFKQKLEVLKIVFIILGFNIFPVETGGDTNKCDFSSYSEIHQQLEDLHA
jgi:hypothetical protein